MGLACGNGEDPVSTERKPKPIRGIGYGDIFAAGGGAAKLKPLPADPSKQSAPIASGNIERLSNNLANTLQKQQIPKKPPPPAPQITSDSSAENTNGSSTSNEQAPALPPKPSSQVNSPNFHPSTIRNQISSSITQPSPFSQPSSAGLQQQQVVRERARVLYAYESSIDDELVMRVGDIINIIDKDIEDAGWWKGELNGKIGVFPDNFVQLIPANEESESVVSQQQTTTTTTTTPSNQDWQAIDSYYNARQTPSLGAFNPSSDVGRVKSVFAATPKGFSKELENNLERHSNGAASFLSLKRNKLQQQQHGLSMDSALATDEHNMDPAAAAAALPMDNGTSTGGRLNHITANRAKGPSRRPPSNVLSKRNQMDSMKREMNGKGEDHTALASLPVTNPTVGKQQQINHESLSSLPVNQNLKQQATSGTSMFSPASSKQQPTESITTPITSTTTTTTNATKPSSSSISLDNVIDNQLAAAAAANAPKTSQRSSQPPQQDKTKPSGPATPPWMVELRRAHAEKKRDTPTTGTDVATVTARVAASLAKMAKAKTTTAADEHVDDSAAVIVSNKIGSAGGASVLPATTGASPAPPEVASERKTSVQSLREAYNPTATTINPVKSISSRYSSDINSQAGTNSQTNPSVADNTAPSLAGIATHRSSLIGSSSATNNNHSMQQMDHSTVSQQQQQQNVNGGNETVISPSNRLSGLLGRGGLPSMEDSVSENNNLEVNSNVPSNNKFLNSKSIFSATWQALSSSLIDSTALPSSTIPLKSCFNLVTSSRSLLISPVTFLEI